MSTANTRKSNHAAAPKGADTQKLRVTGSGASDTRGTLTRQDLALAIFEKCQGLSRREAKRIIDGVIEEMVSVLASGETLKLHDFGSFVVRDKAERAGRNPRTGATVPIESRRVVVFKASPNMKAQVDAGADHREKGKSTGKQKLAAASHESSVA